MILALLWLALAPGDDCRALEQHGRRADAQPCWGLLVRSPEPAQRAEGFWGLRRYKEAGESFEVALKRAPKDPSVRVRYGRLLLERFNPQDAAKLFEEALGLDPKNPGAILGLARIATENFDRKAIDLAQKALEADPKLVEARELLARLYLEDINFPKAAEFANATLKDVPESTESMAVLATVDLLADRASPWLDRIAKVNPRPGAAYLFIAREFVLNRRYEEAIGHFRKAIELEPDLWQAHSELGIQLMRVGRDADARVELERAYEAGFRDFATSNSLRLLDSYKNFVDIRTPVGVLKLNKKESDLLRPYVERELARATAAYEHKYGLKLPRLVQVEMYPLHEDFAVRTMGMPGLGALGVTFGLSVAMDSPSGKPPGSYHWASTLWHEMSHVYVLTATNHRVPRWFTEGVAVHEETQANPEWGDRLSPEIVKAIRENKLLPIESLDRGFIRPEFHGQIIISYFQGGRIIDYIQTRYGWDKVLDLMHGYTRQEPTSDLFPRVLGVKCADFDRDFLAWLKKEHQTPLQNFDAWSKALPELYKAYKAKNWDEVIAKGRAVRDQYPEYVEGGSAYELLAEAYAAKGDKTAARAELERYAKTGGRSPSALKKLATYLEESGDLPGAIAALERLNGIFPVGDDELHQRLGALYAKTKNWKSAVLEYGSVVNGHPVEADVAPAQTNLARALREAGRLEEASDHVLLALEAAPNFRPAQKLLLELNQAKGKN